MYTKKYLLVLLMILSMNISYAQYSSWDFSTLIFSATEGSSVGDTDAMDEIAYRYYNGVKGAPENIEKAIYWFKKSANNESPYAQYCLGTIYQNGVDGVPYDLKEALYWYEKASNHYHHKSSLIAGRFYYHGTVSGVNYYKAARLFKDAAFGGEAEGMSLYAQCYARGRGVNVDSTKALIWVNRAIDLGYANAYWVIGKMYENGESVKQNYQLAKYYYERGDEANDALSQCCLGVMYYNGLLGEPDDEKAIEYITKAADQGEVTAMKNLIKLYDNKNGEFYDIDKAIYWYKKLIEAGEDYYYALAITYEEAELYNNAKDIYEQIIELGRDDDAYNSLAYLYATGKLGMRDYDKAFKYINIAIKKNPVNFNYYDSKGEFYLMKGEQKQAKKLWEYINKNNPKFYSDYISEYGKTSVLDQYMKNLK